MNVRLNSAAYRKKLRTYSEPLIWRLAYIVASLREKSYPKGWTKDTLLVEQSKLQNELELTGYAKSH